MSRKTKAELEAENAWLRSENEILRDLVRMFGEELDAEINTRRIIENAHTADIAKLVQREAGRVRNKWKGFYHHKYMHERFKHYREGRMLPNESRDKANADTAKKFDDYKLLGKRRLIELLKD